jgi:hypothetical protein
LSTEKFIFYLFYWTLLSNDHQRLSDTTISSSKVSKTS